MRLLQAMAGAPHGGAEAFFVRLALAFQRAGVEQCLAIRRNPERARRLADGGLKLVELPFGGILDFRTRRGLRAAIGDFRPSLVLTWMNRATRMCPRGPFVHVGRLGGYYDLKYYWSCDHLIANTRDIAAHIAGQGWPEDRIHYVANFVDDEAAAPVGRSSLGTPDGVPLVLALGRLHRNKAFDVLLEAIRELADVHLWIAGEGPERANLEGLARDLGVAPRVRILGWRDDVAALFAAADVFACPSRHEPLGNVVIEAWAQAKPVVAAASQGPRALIGDGVNGLLAPIDDADALASAIGRVIAEPALAEDFARAGRAAFEAEFTEAKVVAAYVELLSRLGDA